MKATEENMETGAVALQSLIDALGGLVRSANAAVRDLAVASVTADSRKVGPGTLFVAVRVG